MNSKRPTRRLIKSLLVAATATMVAISFTIAPAPLARAEDKPEVRGDEITPAQRTAVERGLEYLAKSQARDGSFGAGQGYGSGESGHVGITALAGIAFMSAGNLPGRGKYGANVSKCLDFILANCQGTGFIASAQGGEMYSHGFATLFLGEIYGMSDGMDDVKMTEVKEKLKKAVKLIEQCQNQQGGWRYQPAPTDADISITICQVMALRAARDAGIKVEKSVIDKAVGYVHMCNCPDGGFSYTAGGGPSGFARTAAGVATLFYAGQSDPSKPEDPDIAKGLNYLKAWVPGKSNNNTPEAGEGHFYYGNYYAVQAMFLAGGDWWSTWYPGIREQLVNHQDKSTGMWNGEAGPHYATAMSLIILQMPNRYLPVFHGKGRGG